eukprot:TRINITY_DN12277_c1_g1_i4.p1 TRINITY_DN12277_c1_g1~~TRINITY_DN12277_c1_g1_i4.p1  ORF type:complete len:149 (-),score=21.16 TRINITY_DN12277_c1_g1_i4:78-524(-)
MSTLICALACLFVIVNSQDFPNVQSPVGFRYVCLNGTTMSIPSAEVAEYKMQTGAVRGPCRIPTLGVLPEIDPEVGYGVFSIGHGGYWIAAGSYQMMFVVHEDGVILVDCPPSAGAKLIKSAIATKTDKPISHIIYSHSHAVSWWHAS